MRFARFAISVVAVVALSGCGFTGAFVKERAAYRAGQLVTIYCDAPMDQDKIRDYMDQRTAPNKARVICAEARYDD